MIYLKTREEIEKMRIANIIVAEILYQLSEMVRPGIRTIELEEECERLVEKYGCIPAFKGYNGYPCCLCTSINEEVVHGIPSRRELKEGDIISIDFGAVYDGYYGDAAITLPVGDVSEKAKRLMQTTEEALYRGIEKAVEGNRLSDISHAIQSWVEEKGFSVVRDFVGHGIGKSLHEEPQIPNFGPPGKGVRLQEGMVLAIEPMVNEGSWEVEILKDRWTAVTKDRSLSCHFEHSVAVTKKGPYILSKI